MIPDTRLFTGIDSKEVDFQSQVSIITLSQPILVVFPTKVYDSDPFPLNYVIKGSLGEKPPLQRWKKSRGEKSRVGNTRIGQGLEKSRVEKSRAE